MEFTKMQGTGNDYVYVDCFKEMVREPAETAIYMDDRRFGVGSDGLILICPSRAADCRMGMYNVDGSQGIMYDNDIRCVGEYVCGHGLVNKDERAVTVETLAGIKMLELETEDGRTVSVTVDMEKATLTSRLPGGITVDGEQYKFVGVDVGNPHAIYYMDRVDNLDLERVGPAFENHARFAPDRVDTESVHVVDRKHLDIRVWKRGSGETWACDTGTTASIMAPILMEYTGDEAGVVLRDRKLVARYDRESSHLLITGPAMEVFRGSIDIPEEICYD